MNSAFRPGYGTALLHLGQTKDELQRVMGAPVRKRVASKLRQYWIYPELDAIVSRKSGKVLSLFLRPAATAVLGGAWIESEGELLRRFGLPSESGGGFTLSDGTPVGRWISYDDGIGFHLGQDGQIETLSIFAPKRSRKQRRSQVVGETDFTAQAIAA